LQHTSIILVIKKGKRNLNQNSGDQMKRAKKAKENKKEDAEENEKEEEI
jgi:hypothetical protein